jgi:hypothetical protein
MFAGAAPSREQVFMASLVTNTASNMQVLSCPVSPTLQPHLSATAPPTRAQAGLPETAAALPPAVTDHLHAHRKQAMAWPATFDMCICCPTRNYQWTWMAQQVATAAWLAACTSPTTSTTTWWILRDTPIVLHVAIHIAARISHGSVCRCWLRMRI